MAKARRNLGKEILEGVREIKRGEHGRVSNLPSVAAAHRGDQSARPQASGVTSRSARPRA